MSTLHCLLLCLPLIVQRTHGFDAGCPSNFSETKDATHYSMTQCALLEVAADFLKATYNVNSIHSVIIIRDGQCDTKVIYSAIDSELQRLRIDKKRLSGAISTIVNENTNRDVVEMFQEATHFHNEAFDAGSLLISQRLDAAIASAKTEDYKQARESFGALLHSVQDFYSHSNWIEIGHREPNKGIGKYEILGAYAWKGMGTCIDCQGESCRTNILPYILENNILTSGYFSSKVFGIGLGQTSKPPGKCSHGGVNDNTVGFDARGGGINKDTSDSDHGHLHRIAANVAFEATKQILNEYHAAIGTESFGLFLGLASSLQNVSANSLIIVMDDTGSMEPYIQMAKQVAINIVNTYRNLTYPPSNYILSPFNDPTWGPLTISKSPQDFVTELSKLRANGGGDEPELYYHGIVEALKVCEVGSSLYAFTDAPAKDAYLKGQAVQLAQDKSVTITLFYAGQGFQPVQSGRSLITAADVIEYLDVNDGNDLSSITGGVIMGINQQALNSTNDYIIQNLQIDQWATIVFVNGFNVNSTFNVDLSAASLKIDITSRNALSPSRFRLIKPSGSFFLPTLTSATPYILMYTIPVQENERGEWTLLSAMNTDHTIQVNVPSQAVCSSTLQQGITESSSNLSFTPLKDQPVKGDTNLYVLTLCENLPSSLKSGLTHLRDAKNGSRILQTLTPIEVSSTGFLSKLTVPDVAFRFNTIVQLKDGTTVERSTKRTVSPTSISLTIDDQPYFVRENETLTMNFTIFNHGESSLMVAVRITDTLGLLLSDGILKAYNLAGLGRKSDSVIMQARNLMNTNSNSTVTTDSVLFSITALAYKNNQNVPVYIMRESVVLNNQTDYQQPPTARTTTRTTATPTARPTPTPTTTPTTTPTPTPTTTPMAKTTPIPMPTNLATTLSVAGINFLLVVVALFLNSS